MKLLVTDELQEHVQPLLPQESLKRWQMNLSRKGLGQGDTQDRHGRSCVACQGFLRVSLVLLPFLALPNAAWAGSAQAGLTTTEVMRNVAIWTAGLAIAVLVIVELFLRRRIGRAAYHWLLLVGLFALPLFSMTATTAVVMEESKTVNSCASCHSMDPFVNDMRNPASKTLAASHYLNKWIGDDQCYQCHTTYGIHGTLEAKRDGLRHWWRYVTDDWQRPISYPGKYPDADCLKCHEGTPGYQNAQAHQEAFAALAAGEVDCLFCHGPVHPSAEQRKNMPKYPSDKPQTNEEAAKSASSKERSDR
jgi:cytochrome c nitrite reductase small subunit